MTGAVFTNTDALSVVYSALTNENIYNCLGSIIKGCLQVLESNNVVTMDSLLKVFDSETFVAVGGVSTEQITSVLHKLLVLNGLDLFGDIFPDGTGPYTIITWLMPHGTLCPSFFMELISTFPRNVFFYFIGELSIPSTVA